MALKTLPSLLLAVFLTFFLSLPASVRAEKPNIVFIFADDMGYADLSCYGAPDAKTPNIDQLAADGLKFTNLYAQGPECTPSRTSILTGKYPQRAGGMECAIGTGNVGRYDDAIRLAKTNDLGLPPEQATLAPGLKAQGYTNAIFGKWHMGYEPKFNPLDQGFDEFTGYLGGNVDYYRHRETSPLDVYIKGREPIEREGYTTELITDDAIDFLNRQKEKPDHPFFLYLPHAAPHFPFQPPNSDTGKMHPLDTWTLGPRSDYVKMVEFLDAEVGRLLKTLEENGQADNTLVVFASDHGAMVPGVNSPWRNYKGTVFEGGLRVPCIVRWPGVVQPGSVSTQIGTLMDLTHSFLRIGGAPEDSLAALDGIDILNHVLSGKPDMARTLYWRAKRGEETWWAIRDGDRKYLRRKDGAEAAEEWYFDLAKDPTETNDFFATRQGEVKELKAKLKAWEEEVKTVR